MSPSDPFRSSRYSGLAMSHNLRELARAVYEAVDRGDLDAFIARVHPDIEMHSLIAEAEDRIYKGHDGVREWWGTVADSLGRVRFEPGQVESFRDRGIAQIRMVGTVEGVEVAQTMWHAFRVRDGLLVWSAAFRTEAEGLEAVGLRE